ncbi:Galactokinase [Halorhabdus sp. SVX81]|uniref:galactokinase n=1 Tax=Halorhabdus sp. SVX81 TaxID=2978283 RepID=UPI0023DCE1D4|nr:galactokinase [Halorhabdus sp. SVX81]WEL17733.1 Galactokinase [Halorhabdus sp. SVX81]
MVDFEGDYTVRSPGRVNLIGGHTDYTLGYVMPLATDLQTRLEATVSEDVHVSSSALESSYSFATDDLEPVEDWVDYVKGCYAILQAAGYDPGGFRGDITTTLPIGAGLSSSASLELAVMALLNEAYDLGLSRERMARLSQRVENDYVGVACGIMDQFAVALGQDGHALSIDTETLTYTPVPFPDGIEILVFHTGVSRGLVESAYNQRRETVEGALEKLDVDSSTAVTEADLVGLPPRERERLGYVVRENARVQRAQAALEDGEIQTFGEILLSAHRDIADHYDASCKELDFVVETALEAGAYGARLTGAGWGGAAIAVVDTETVESVATSIEAAYREQFPEHDPHYYRIEASDGVRVTHTG